MTEAKRLIRGEGELAELVRTLDWSATPLGAMEQWPGILLASVNMILSAPVPMQLFWGPQFVCIYNDSMAPALSTKHPASLGVSAKVVWQEAWPLIGPQMEQALCEGKAVYLKDALVPLMRDGALEDQYWTYSYSPVFDAAGAIVGVLDVAQNTTESVLNRRERDSALVSLAKSEQRFRSLVDRASVGIHIGDTGGALTYMNHSLLDLLGYAEAEVRDGSMRWDRLTPDAYAAADRKAMEELKRDGVARPYEKAYIAKDGRHVPFRVGAALIPALAEGSASDDIAVFFTDLTEQKKAEAALVHSEKLAAVGKLASTISHEINNPLEAVTNLLYIVRHDPSLSQSAKDYLQVADRELARVSQVTVQTLRFHRQATAAMTVRPESLVDEVLELYAARLANSEIEIRREYAPNVQVTCYEGDIRQVLNNLVGNAMDAMRTGGRLVVRTRSATRWSSGQQGVRITIADTGQGISRPVLGRIFDAFFTTKGLNGTGLGLWISCRIVHKHRGSLRACSSTDPKQHGTVFSMWLPLELAPSARESLHAGADPGWTPGPG